MAKILTYAPAVGLLGLALYQAANDHNYVAAGQSVMQALAIFGIGPAVHAVHSATVGK